MNTSKNGSSNYKETLSSFDVRNNSVVRSLIYGSISSSITTVAYQPLELLKTRIQLNDCQVQTNSNYRRHILGCSIRYTKALVYKHGFFYLWTGTGASLSRSVPGVGLYYAFLNVLQTKFSNQSNKPDNSSQAFLFGLTARSIVSLVLLPVTSTKVRYESGRYKYESLARALKDAYLHNGWVGVSPTILRDSLFSAIYYTCYTKLKSHASARNTTSSPDDSSKPKYSRNFLAGIVSGFIASVITNPLDVIKTHMQIKTTHKALNMQQALKLLLSEGEILRLFDGLVPRCLRRAMIAATTWTFYDILIESSDTR